MWFGTLGGLNKYDGYDFDIVIYNPSSNKNLTNQAVEVIAEDKYHTLWIGTKSGGLNSYDILRDSFVHYYPSSKIQIQEIKSLLVAKSGILYIGAIHGLYTFYKGKFNLIANEASILSIVEDLNGNIYLGTNKGLVFYNTVSKSLKNIPLNKTIIITSLALNTNKQVLY